MKPRVTHALYLWMLVALALRAAPAEAQEKLPVLEPVEVSGYQGDEGQGLPLTFKRLKPNPALALWTVGEAREVVEALEEEFQQEGWKLVDRLDQALSGCWPRADCRTKLVDELGKIAGDVCKQGSRLNKLATRKP